MPAHEHATDQPHNAPSAQRFTVHGDFVAESFLELIADRARWLDLDGWARAAGSHELVVVATGPEAMVGALEMALMLGPLDALVQDVQAREEIEPIASGFAVYPV